MPETHLSSDARHGQNDGESRPRPLFAPTPTPRASAGTVLAFVVVVVLMLAGFYMMAHAFSSPDLGLAWFAGGLLVDAFAFWFAFGILPSFDSRR
ncbi:hypothetical protein [Leucobacter triazinivorans]|uniref:Uncharacterized protein n=1 Tax=Leucobacter triazinivorans TaxID=1784719 RepID=A0A4P6KDJ8_9MICO|nr:hypothetical protein [Leucobacter triazinivorans]QBE48387.1 hypothetical protein EVS81_05660 [Leucobacter triazinivorans]